MLLSMHSGIADAYKSASQRARVISEFWAEENLYCPACTSDSLSRLPHNTKSLDFKCASCDTGYQLKSGSKGFGRCIPDGTYATMRATIVSGRTPSLFMLHYDLANWKVRNLSVVPSFAFPLSCLQRREALSATARRAGWVGCNIVLTNIPPDARIPMVADGIEEKPSKVRRRYGLLRPIADLNATQKGWALDVLNVVRSLGGDTFTLRQILEHSRDLQRLHPENRHVEAKIRQQLQVLRDLGLLEFVDNRGTYRLKERLV